MTNLLPQKYLDLVRKEHHARVWIVSLVALLVTVITGMFFLTPSLVLSNAGARDAEHAVELTRRSVEQQEKGSILTEVRRTKGQIELLQEELSKITVTEMLATIEESLSPEIILTSISHSRKNDVNDVIVLNGIASTRDELLSFARRLDHEELLSNVDLPVSSLAKSTDITFSISLEVLSESVRESTNREMEPDDLGVATMA